MTGAPALDALRASLDRLRDDGLAPRLPDGATVELIEATGSSLPAPMTAAEWAALRAEAERELSVAIVDAPAHNPGARVVATGERR